MGVVRLVDGPVVFKYDAPRALRYELAPFGAPLAAPPVQRGGGGGVELAVLSVNPLRRQDWGKEEGEDILAYDCESRVPYAGEERAAVHVGSVLSPPDSRVHG